MKQEWPEPVMGRHPPLVQGVEDAPERRGDGAGGLGAITGDGLGDPPGGGDVTAVELFEGDPVGAGGASANSTSETSVSETLGFDDVGDLC